MNARRSFFRTAARVSAAGGAAVLLPEAAMAELRRHSGLRDAAEKVLIEETVEVSPEEVQRLMARVRELEHAVSRGPYHFAPRPERAQQFSQEFTDPALEEHIQKIVAANPHPLSIQPSISAVANPDGTVHITDNMGQCATIDTCTHVEELDFGNLLLYQRHDLIRHLVVPLNEPDFCGFDANGQYQTDAAASRGDLKALQQQVHAMRHAMLEFINPDKLALFPN